MKMRHLPAAFVHSPGFVLRHGAAMLAHTFTGTSVRSILGLEGERAVVVKGPQGRAQVGCARLEADEAKHHERGALAQEIRDAIGDVAALRSRDSHHGRDRVRQRRRIGQRCEIDEDDAVRVSRG